jgi:hypothetical protein
MLFFTTDQGVKETAAACAGSARDFALSPCNRAKIDAVRLSGTINAEALDPSPALASPTPSNKHYTLYVSSP